MAELRLSFLGAPQVERNGEPLEISANKALALLVYLAVTGQSHTRDALSTLLWPEQDQSRGRTYLRHALWTLKQALGERWLLPTREQIAFNTDDAVWLDVRAFREGIAAVDAHDHAGGQMCSNCLAQLQAAADLYDHDFLAGFSLPDAPAFDEWHFFEAEELRQTLARALEQLVQEHGAGHAYDRATHYARRWLALDPLQESVHRILMRLYTLAGQQAAALRQYQECVRLLSEELGVEPEPETVRLHESIRTRQLGPWLAGPDSAAASSASQPHRLETLLAQAGHGQAEAPEEQRWLAQTTGQQPHQETLPFVAREQELARLDQFLGEALGGQPQVAFILGEAGQGKTALLHEFARRALERHPSLIVAGGNCNAYTGQGDPYLPFREILALLTADLDAWSLGGMLPQGYAERIRRFLPQTMQALVEIAPDLIDTFVPLGGLLERSALANSANRHWRQELVRRAGTKVRGPDPNLQQSALLEQYTRMLQALCRQAPMLLVLDDLQWADPGSVTLLFYLGRRLSGCPIFILGAYRPADVALGRDREPHPLGRAVGELQRIFGDCFVDLGRADARGFVDAWLDLEPNRLADFFRQTLYRQTGGHPLFTVELVRAMQERGSLRQDVEGVWEMQTEINWNSMPLRVEGVIGERVQRLTPRLRELLQVASVEGEEFTAEVVARVLHLDERETVRLLSRELDKVHSLVRATGTRRAGGHLMSRYRFRHILIQRYLYNLLDEVEQIYQHEAVGNALEALHGQQAAEVAVQLARHFEIAQHSDKAATYLQLAGDQARRTAALSEALRHYQAALAQWPASDQPGRARIMRQLGECQWMTGHAAKALETFESAYDAFRILANVEEAGAIQRLTGRVYWEVGEREKSLDHYRQALSLLEPLGESVELAWAISSISQMHMLAGENARAIEWGERALTLARDLDAEAVIVHALNNVGSAYLNGHQVEQGRTMLQESIRRALDANMPHDACRGQLNLAEGLASHDNYQEAYEIFAALASYSQRVHTTLYAGSSLVELARLDWLGGRWREALARAPLITDWLRRGQSLAYLHVIASILFAQQYNDLGQADTAYHALQETEESVKSVDELQLTAPHQAQLVRALVARGEIQEAKQVARRLLAVMARANYDSRYSVAPLLNICGVLVQEVAGELLDHSVLALNALSQQNAIRQIASQQATLQESWGMVALAQGDILQATESFAEAYNFWQRVQRPYDQARALSKLGDALLQTGQQAEAMRSFAAADQLIADLSAQLDDEELKAAFTRSALVKTIRHGLPGGN